MRGQAGPSAKEIKSLSEFEKFVSSEDASVVGFFEGESKLKDSFLKVADTERDRFRFGYTSNAEILKKAGYTEYECSSIFSHKNNFLAILSCMCQNNYTINSTQMNSNTMETMTLTRLRTSSFTRSRVLRVCELREISFNLIGDLSLLFITMWTTLKTLRVCIFRGQNIQLSVTLGTNYWRNRVLKVAQDYKRKAYFAVSNKEEFSQVLNMSKSNLSGI